MRVDGTDTLIQTISTFASKSGEIAFKYTPRHSIAVANKFGFTNTVIASASASATYGISIITLGSTAIQAIATMSGTTTRATYASPTLNAGTTYTFKLTYLTGGNLELMVDGTSRATASIGSSTVFATPPTTFYFGSNPQGTAQNDGTFDMATGINGQIYVNTTAPYYKFGSQSTQVVAQDATTYSISITPTAASHTLSAYVYNGTTGSVGGTIDGSVATLYWEGRVVNTTYTDMGGGWWRLSYSSTSSASSNSYGLWVAPGKTVYVDGVQLEALAYATTYADGTLCTGYAWTGTANNSTSTRTRVNVKYPNTGNISFTAGSVSLWVKRVVTANTRQFHFGIGGDGFTIESWNTGGAAFTIKQSNNTYKTTTPGGSFSQGQWIHFLATWSGSNLTMYVDGSSVGTNDTWDGTVSSVVSSSDIRLGYYQDASDNLFTDSILSDLRIFDRALSSGQVAQLYYAGLGSHQEAAAVKRFANPEEPMDYYKMDEGTGTTLNDSGPGQNDGTRPAFTLNSPVNLPTWQTEDMCVAGKCLYFEGSNATASAQSATISGIMSLSFWAKPASSSGTIPLISLFNWTGEISVSSTNLAVTTSGITSPTVYVNGRASTALSAGGWNHIEITTATPFNATNPVLGKIQTTYFKGFLDEVKFYNYARTAAQVKSDFNGAAKRGTGASQGDALRSQGVPLLNQGLVGYWRMDESSWNGTSGEVLDASGNGNNGTAVSGATTGAGKFGNGGSFDGSTQYINGGINLPVLTNGTISVWVKPSSLAGWPMVVTRANGTGNNWELALSDGGNAKPYFGYNGAVLLSTNSTVSINQWIHLVVTVSSTFGSKIYLNGTLENSSSTLTTFRNANGVLYFAERSDGNYLGGSLDELRIYNRALSPAEVRQLYNFAPGPVAHWKFDEGSGTRVNDSGGAQNDGTWSGTGTHWVTGKFGKAGGFNGGNDYVTVTSVANDEFDLLYKVSVSAWIKPTSIHDTNNYIISRRSAGGNGYSMLVNSTNKFKAIILNGATLCGDTDSVATIANSTWTHVAFNFDGSNLYTYINGVLDRTFVCSTTLPSQTRDVVIGTYNSLAAQYNFSGSLDDVKIYNYARTPDQIMEDMQGRTDSGVSLQGVTAGGKGTLINLKMDEGSGTTTKDSSGNQKNGTLNDGATWNQNGKYGRGIQLDGSNDDISISDFAY